MAVERIICGYCGKPAWLDRSHVIHSRAQGWSLYCDRKCAGLGRRINKSKEQKRAEKAAYDRLYRAKNIALIKNKKKAYFQRTYDPIKAAAERKKTMARHVEYCRRPEYKKYKQGYDKKYRAKKEFGPFAEAAMLVVDLNREIKQRMTNHEIKWQNKTTNKRQFRARAEKETTRSRPRHRERRPSHTAAHSG